MALGYNKRKITQLIIMPAIELRAQLIAKWEITGIRQV